MCGHLEEAGAGSVASGVGRAEGVEVVAAPVDQAVAAFVGPTEQVGHPCGGQHLGEIGDGVEVTALDELVGELVGEGLGVGSELGEGSGGERPQDDVAQSSVLVAVAHQRRAASGVVDEVVEADPLSRAEHGGVVEHRSDVVVAGHGVQVVGAQPDDWSEVAQRPVVLVRVGEGVIGEEVDVVDGDHAVATSRVGEVCG